MEPHLYTCLTISLDPHKSLQLPYEPHIPVTHAAAINLDRRSASVCLRTYLHDDEMIFVTTWPMPLPIPRARHGEVYHQDPISNRWGKDPHVYNHGRSLVYSPGSHTAIAGR